MPRYICRMSAPVERRPTTQHYVEYAATRLVVGALRQLGWRTSSTLGAWLARLAWWPFGIRREVTRRQIAAAFPNWPPERVQRVARGAYDNLGRTSIETATLPGTPAAEILARVSRVDGWHHVEAARTAGQGIIGVTGHLGNWELAGAYFAARGVPVSAVVRGMANPVFENWVTRTRRKADIEVVHDRDAVRRTPRALRENRLVGFLADHDALGLASTFVPFFGRPAKTPRGPAVFALRLGAPVLFITMVRQPDARYALLIEPIEVAPTGDREADVDAIVLQFTERLEARVRDYPEQYFWQHRRWRRQPPDTPPHLREP